MRLSIEMIKLLLSLLLCSEEVHSQFWTYQNGLQDSDSNDQLFSNDFGFPSPAGLVESFYPFRELIEQLPEIQKPAFITATDNVDDPSISFDKRSESSSLAASPVGPPVWVGIRQQLKAARRKKLIDRFRQALVRDNFSPHNNLFYVKQTMKHKIRCPISPFYC